MAAFVRTVEAGSFSAAARELELSPSALSKVVGRLEQRLAVRLLNRSTRVLTLTPEGTAYYHRARRILADIADAESEVAEFNTRPRGILRVRVDVAFGTYQLVPSVQTFLARFPEVKLEIVTSDGPLDFAAQNIDLAIGLDVVADASIAARKICDLERIVCASPAYIAAYGMPSRPDDLAHHNCLTLDRTSPGASCWPFQEGRKRRVVEVAGNVVANNADALLNLALNGAGIVRLSDITVGNALRTGQLVPLLAASHCVEPLPLMVSYVDGRQDLPQIAAMLEFLFVNFSHAPWRTVHSPFATL
jgi:DNA-binding transcriptional LysR family regulator